MIRYAEGDLLDSGAQALVNAVNCEGVMGKGIALAFRRRFPEHFRSYRRACAAGEVQPGRMHVDILPDGRSVIAFPTKSSWRQPSRLDWISEGIPDLVRTVRNLGVRSVAVPQLGCGAGGLDWTEVRPLLVKGFAPYGDTDVLLYGPAPPDFSVRRRLDDGVSP